MSIKKLFLILAAVTVIFVACKKENNDTQASVTTPVKQTIHASMDVTGMVFYGNVTYNYTYDDDYRLVRIEEFQADDNYVIRDMYFIYSDNHISIIGMSEGYNVINECTLDEQGRITEMIHSGNSNYTNKYTYDTEGHMVTATQITDDGDLISTYVWENGELIMIHTGNGTGNGDRVLTFETSDAPAQALFNRMKYDNDVSELCAQGCFGTLPAHMPSRRSLTLYLNDISVNTITTDYSYTVEDGRLATCQAGKNMTFNFCWEER